MGYIRAEEILPADVIKQIQQYVDGANIYIPRKQENRLAWGTKTAYRHELQKRDKAIYNSYLDGKSVLSEIITKKVNPCSKQLGR